MAINEERNLRKYVGGWFVLAIKHEFVTISDGELDRIYCKVRLVQWKPSKLLLESLVPLFTTISTRARVLSLAHCLTFFRHYCLYVEPGSCSSVRRATILSYWTSSHTFMAWLFFGFPYSNHIHCVLALRALGWKHNEYDLLLIPLVGRVLRNIITWRRLWKYSFPWYNDLYVKLTDTHWYLHRDSCHPSHCKRGIPDSQALRIRRIRSKMEESLRRIQELKAT